jgi:hypothetical protein
LHLEDAVMSKQNAEASVTAAKSQPVTSLSDSKPGVSMGVASEPTVIGGARVFRDNVFTSRTLVMPDGRTISVTKGQVTASDDDLFEFLSAHPDLATLQE